MGKRVLKKRTTKKQIDANHANAKKSIGPRTAEGKARVRLNAIKHGLRAEQVVVLGGPTAEDPAEFDSLLSNMLHDCKPEGDLPPFYVPAVMRVVSSVSSSGTPLSVEGKKPGSRGRAPRAAPAAAGLSSAAYAAGA